MMTAYEKKCQKPYRRIAQKLTDANNYKWTPHIDRNHSMYALSLMIEMIEKLHLSYAYRMEELASVVKEGNQLFYRTPQHKESYPLPMLYEWLPLCALKRKVVGSILRTLDRLTTHYDELPRKTKERISKKNRLILKAA